MTLDEFWEHIRATRRKDPDAHQERLVQRLAKLPREEIVDFAHWWNVMMDESYSRDLWAAAYYANGGCSEDGFIDFRSWLILQGRDVFQAVVADPNALVDHVGGGNADGEFMCESNPAGSAWDIAFWRGPAAMHPGAAFNALYESRHPEPLPTRELGESWDFDDPEQRKLRLPRFAGDD
jgi:hypothetical protein